MVGAYIIGSGKVSDRAGDFQDPIIGAGGKRELLHGLLQQVSEGGVYGAVFADLGMGHACVRGDLRAIETRVLTQAGILHASANAALSLAELRREALSESSLCS
jgi:hypothetical protein